MLTAEHVQTRRRGDELSIVPLDAERRGLAAEMAAVYRQIALAHEGRDRASFLDACKSVTAAWPQKHRRLADGVFKLVLDGCVFEEETPLDAAEVRQIVFARAAESRRGASASKFDREQVIASAASHFEQPHAVIEAALYGDLPGAHVLRHVHVPPPEALVARYQLAQVQAVLLRATRVTLTMSGADPTHLRALFRTLKFQQLLFTITPLPKNVYQIEIDGPFSLFESVTRYGLKLALALPAITACAGFSLTAHVLWGRERLPLRFRCKDDGSLRPPAGVDVPKEPEAIDTIRSRWPGLASRFTLSSSSRVLDLPGVGLCVPDLEFSDPASGMVVYYEQLGFWSREAVWKRVELVQAGLPFPIVFGVSKSLRVSEAVLSDDLPAALYVFGKIPNARALLERIERVAARPRS